MARTTQWVKISGWLFLLGMLVAVVDGIPLLAAILPAGLADSALVGLGFVVGLLAFFGMSSVNKDETEMFLLATIALVAVGASGTYLTGVPYIGASLAGIAGNIAALVAPIAVLIAIRAVWDAAAAKWK